MGFKNVLGKFGRLVKKFGPIVLHEVAPQLDPIASVIVHAVDEAEGIPGASGPEKLEHVQQIGSDAASAFNAVSKGTKIDTASLRETIAEGVGAVVASANVLVKP